MTEPETTSRRSFGDRLDALGSTSTFLIVAAPVFAIYLLTASWTHPVHTDAFTNVLSARALGAEGTLQLDDHASLAEARYHDTVAWVEEGENGPISRYPPGAALHAAPLYVLASGELQPTLIRSRLDPDAGIIEIGLPPLWPAAVTSAGVTAAAMGILALSFASLTPGRLAVGGAYLAALGTSAWSVSADALWQHGPAMLWIALASLLAARAHLIGSGLAYAASIIVRPLTAVIAVGTVGVLVVRRRFSALVTFLIAVSVGAAAIVAYNAVVFGEPSLSGGYSSGFREKAVSASPLWYVGNVAGGLFSPTRGVLLWSPFLLLLLPGVPSAWRRAPDWVRGPAVGAILYILLQWRANRYSGGDGYQFYRYPLEPLMAAAPLLILSYSDWIKPRPGVHRAFIALSAVAIAAHLAAAA